MGLLDGKVVLITGAGNGIGREHALACARAGAKVVVNDIGVNRDGTANQLSPADVVVGEIQALGGDAVANGDSVTDPAGCARMVAAALERFGRLDAVVNNAGILRDRTFVKMTEREWDPVIDVHLTGTKNVCAAAIGALSRQGGAIINTSSVSGLIGNFGQANYAAAKAGIYGLTRVLSMELRRAGVTANCVAPVALTRMTEDLPAERFDPTWTADRISPVVVFLISELGRGVTGRVFGVAGQRLHAYEMQVNEGVTKAGSELWTPEEIAEKIEDILSFSPKAEPAPSAGTDEVSAVFDCFPEGFRAEKAAGWKANIQWRVQGGTDQTLLVQDGVRVVHGLEGKPTCTVKVDRDTLVSMFKGELDPQKAFMSGKASADDFSDLLRMSVVFDFAKVGLAYRARSGGAPTPPPPPAPASQEAPGEKVYPIGKTWDGGYFFARPEHIAAYARATGDLNPAYEGPDAIAPPMFHVRLMNALLFRIATDPELGLDMLRLVHGEHAATFHRPIRPWDFVQVRGKLLSVEQKSSGLLVSSGLYGFIDGELAVECRTLFFIRGPSKGEGKPKAPPQVAVTADYTATIEVPPDASLVYAVASLDDNPIHTDPATAKAAGLPDIILQGLCTMAMTVREAVRHAGGDDPRRLLSASVRFARPVLNGTVLSTIGWQQEDGSWSVETLGPDGKAVITGASMRFRG